MEIYLIRHTQTNTPQNVCYGQTDVPLTASFLEDTRDILKRLPPCDTVFSSPLTRCVRLAQLISEEVILEPRLLEMNFGDWENASFSEIEAKSLYYWTENFVTHSPPNGESFTELCQRVEQFWNYLITLEHDRVVVVTHAGVIRAWLAVILQMPYANAFHFQVNYASLHKLCYKNNYAYIEFLNLV